MPKIQGVPSAFTIGAIARKFKAKIHQVEYVIRKHRVRPVAQAGIAFVYGAAAVRFIGRKLAEIVAAQKQIGKARLTRARK